MAENSGHFNRQIGRNRFVLFLGALVILWLLIAPQWGNVRALLAAFDLSALLFLLSCAGLLRLHQDRIRDAARANDVTRVVRLVLALLLVIVVFAAMAAQIADRQALPVGEKLLLAATLVMVWTFANTMYALHYAHLFYSNAPDGSDSGGLEFPGEGRPDMADFAYFAFTIGVAVQTADVAISSPRIRRVVTVHAILGFFFNIGVLALSINVLGSS